MWDAETGRCLLTLEGHRNAVRACAWSPDGKRLLSGSEDSTLRLWDSDSGRCLAIYYLGPDREAATLDGAQRRILWASPGAWRFLGWRVHDEAAGRIRILPAEWNGPLPT